VPPEAVAPTLDLAPPPPPIGNPRVITPALIAAPVNPG
jgi:hypothetical protein